jgi:hypothetical protein
MKAVIDAVAGDCEVSLEEIDISGDAALEARFGSEIPVLFINDRKAFKYRLSAAALRRRLRHEEPGGWSLRRLRERLR